MLELPEGKCPQYPQNFDIEDQNKVERDRNMSKEGAEIIKNAISTGKV